MNICQPFRWCGDVPRVEVWIGWQLACCWQFESMLDGSVRHSVADGHPVNFHGLRLTLGARYGGVL